MTEHLGNATSLFTAASCFCGIAALLARVIEVHMLRKAPPVHMVIRWCLLICAGITVSTLWSALHGSADPWLMASGVIASIVSACSLFFR